MRFGVLVRHFFTRFADRESLSPDAEAGANLGPILGLLATPSAFIGILFIPLTFWGWDLARVRMFFVCLSMLAMAFLVVLRWDALFPDRRDYQLIMPLPVPLATVFFAKIGALAVFLALFLADINFFGVLFWPGIDPGASLLRIWGAHLAAVLSGGLFGALAAAAVEGVLITVFRGAMLRRVSLCIQALLIAGLITLLLVTPLMPLGRLVEANSPALYWYPGFWFAGLYEQLRPATGNARFAHLGVVGLQALGIAAGVFLLTFLPGYRRHARRVLEAPEPNPAGPGRLRLALAGVLDRTLLTHPVERATFHFIGVTMARSMRHRVFLAVYGGLGAALAVMSLGSGRAGLARLPLTLSFILVSGLRAAFNVPAELRANWSFQITESKVAERYVAAARKWIVACAILPVFLLLAPMEFACFPWPAALIHGVFGITLSVLLMELMFFGFHKVPFACSYFPGKTNMVGLAAVYCYGFTTYTETMARVEAWLVRTPAAALVFFGCAAAALAALAAWRRGRLPSAAGLDFEDAGDPVVRTLGLSS